MEIVTIRMLMEDIISIIYVNNRREKDGAEFKLCENIDKRIFLTFVSMERRPKAATVRARKRR